jgi:WD40 repeat protein/serine/threonine protein kinase
MKSTDKDPSQGAPARADSQVTQAVTARQPANLLRPAETDDEMGQLGPYRVLGILGQGGMGVVFLAEDPQLNRKVALKAMLPGVGDSATGRERFFREARAAAALRHPNVVTVFQIGEDGETPYLAMELLRGETLETRLNREHRLPWRELLGIGGQIAKGLAAAHEKGLVHRDIKPANIWIEEGEGNVKILDFRVARPVSIDQQITQNGNVVGTPAFMSPEQAAAQPVDHRCDLFSLGCVLYRMCAGELPFKGKDALAVVSALAVVTPAAPASLNPQLPIELSNLIMQLLAKRPADRPATAKEVAEALFAMARTLAEPNASPEKINEPKLTGGRTETFTSMSAVAPIRNQRKRLLVGLGLGLIVGVAFTVLWLAGAFRPGEPSTDSIKSNPSQAGQPEELDRASQQKANPARIVALGPTAFVQSPTPIPGIRSWSLEYATHRGRVFRIVISPDDHFIATGGEDGSVRVWRTKGGQLVRVLLGHAHDILSLAWSRDGKYLASGDRSGAIRVWEIETGQTVKVFQEKCPVVLALAWSPDGMLASAGAFGDHGIRIWNIATGDLKTVLYGHTNNVFCLAWSPKGAVLASASEDKTALLWSVGSGEKPKLLGKHENHVSAVAWSPDSQTLATVGRGMPLRLWNLESGESLELDEPQGYNRFANWLLSWSSDGNVIAMGDPALIWRRNGKQWFPSGKLDHGHFEISLSSDGKTIASGGQFGMVLVEETLTGAKIIQSAAEQQSWPLALAAKSETSEIAIGYHDGHATVFNVAKSAVTNRFDVEGEPRSVAWSPDGTRIACVTPLSIRMWDTTKKTRQGPDITGFEFFSLAWPREEVMVTGSMDGIGRIWQLPERKVTRELKGHEKGAIAVAVAKDGETLATCGWEGAGLRIWSIRGGNLLETPTSPGCSSAAWSPDGKMLATTNHFHARIWQTGAWQSARTIQGIDDPVCLAWSATGKVLAIGNFKGDITLFDANSAEAIGSLNNLPFRVGCMSWLSSDIIAGGGADGSLRFWDAKTGRQVGVLLEFREGRHVLISADGHYRGTPGVETTLVYVVQRDDGAQALLTETQMRDTYRWKNQPENVVLLAR